MIPHGPQVHRAHGTPAQAAVTHLRLLDPRAWLGFVLGQALRLVVGPPPTAEELDGLDDVIHEQAREMGLA